jgi:hypothetical protein
MGFVFWIVIIIIYALISSIFSAWLASEKGYSGISWFLLGLFFGIIALITIGFAPIQDRIKVTTQSDEFEQIRNKNEQKEKTKEKCRNAFPEATHMLVKNSELYNQPLEKRICNLNNGEPVIFISSMRDTAYEFMWFHIKTTDGKQGWVYADDLEKI